MLTLLFFNNKTALICVNSAFTGFYFNCEYQIRIIGTDICGKISIKIGGKMRTNIGAKSGGKISGKSC